MLKWPANMQVGPIGSRISDFTRSHHAFSHHFHHFLKCWRLFSESGQRNHCIRAWSWECKGELPFLNANCSSRMKCWKKYFETDPFVVKKKQLKRCVNRNQASEPVRTTSVSSIFIEHWQGKSDMSGTCWQSCDPKNVRIVAEIHNLSFRVKNSQIRRFSWTKEHDSQLQTTSQQWFRKCQEAPNWLLHNVISFMHPIILLYLFWWCPFSAVKLRDIVYVLQLPFFRKSLPSADRVPRVLRTASWRPSDRHFEVRSDQFSNFQDLQAFESWKHAKLHAIVELLKKIMVTYIIGPDSEAFLELILLMSWEKFHDPWTAVIFFLVAVRAVLAQPKPPSVTGPLGKDGWGRKTSMCATTLVTRASLDTSS